MQHYTCLLIDVIFSCADPEGGGGKQGVLTPLKNFKNIGFSSIQVWIP